MAWGYDVPGLVGHLWSLSAEEQFYVVWPVALVVALRRGASEWILFAGLAVGLAVVAIEGVALEAAGAPDVRIHLAPDTCAAPLLLGCAFAILRRQRVLPAADALVVAAAATVAAVFLAGAWMSPYLFAGPLLVFCSAAGFLVARLADDATPRAAAFGAPARPARPDLVRALHLARHRPRPRARPHRRRSRHCDRHRVVPLRRGAVPPTQGWPARRRPGRVIDTLRRRPPSTTPAAEVG